MFFNWFGNKSNKYEDYYDKIIASPIPALEREIDKCLEDFTNERRELKKFRQDIDEQIKQIEETQQRQRYLFNSLGELLSQNNIPVTPQNIKWVMQQIQAQQNEYSFVEQQMIYWRKHYLELVIRQIIQKLPYPPPVVEQTVAWMVQQVGAEQNEIPFIQQQMLYERQEYLAHIIRYSLQNLGRPIPANLPNINWLLQYINAQFQCQCQPDEGSFFGEQMQLYWSGQPLPISRKIYLKNCVVDYCNKRVAHYHKRSGRSINLSNQQDLAAIDRQKQVNDYHKYLNEKRLVERLENTQRNWEGLGSSLSRDLANEQLELRKRWEAAMLAADSSEQFSQNAAKFQKLAQEEERKLKYYEQLNVDVFTEGLVDFILTETLD
jgi:hypothetical protein